LALDNEALSRQRRLTPDDVPEEMEREPALSGHALDWHGLGELDETVPGDRHADGRAVQNERCADRRQTGPVCDHDRGPAFRFAKTTVHAVGEQAGIVLMRAEVREHAALVDWSADQ